MAGINNKQMNKKHVEEIGHTHDRRLIEPRISWVPGYDGLTIAPPSAQ